MKYKNVGYFFLILFAIVIIGFFKTYFGLFPHFNDRTTILVHFHATVLTLWVILLIIQPLLIRYKKFAIHRLLGKFTYILVPLIICSFIGMINKQYNEEMIQKIPRSEIIEDISGSVAILLLFATIYILAIINKKKVAFHMRYMIATGLLLINAPLTRITLFWNPFSAQLFIFVLTDLILLVLIFFDKRKKRRYKPYIVTLILFLAQQTLELPIFWSMSYNH
jgi:hypothetical protein